VRIACAVVLTCALGALRPRQNFRSNVLTVPVTVTVVDGSGRLITGLTQQDFEIFEDGTLQAVTTFTNERVAVSLGVLLDVSDSMRGQKMTDAGMAVERFVGDLLRGEDEAFIGLFNHRPRLASAWTRPPSSLKDRLTDVKPTGGTAIYDAVGAVGRDVRPPHQAAGGARGDLGRRRHGQRPFAAAGARRGREA
jgi:VWFA-related protein